MLAADGIETAFAGTNDILLAAGGNGIALGLLGAWAVMHTAEVRTTSEDVEVISAAVAAAVLILLPLVDDYASVFAGLAGGLVGAGCWAGRRSGSAGAPTPPSVGQGCVHLDHAAIHRYSVDHSSFRDRWSPRSSRRARTWETSPSCRSPATRQRSRPSSSRRSSRGGPSRSGRSSAARAIAIARGLPDDGRLILELDVMLERARDMRGAGLDGKVEIRVGPALEDLQAMDREQFDFAFIDADKTEYIDDFEEVLARLRSNGVIMIDNTLREGTVLDPESESARVTAELNDRLAKDERVDVVLLGLADRITMARKQ